MRINAKQYIDKGIYRYSKRLLSKSSQKVRKLIQGNSIQQQIFRVITRRRHDHGNRKVFARRAVIIDVMSVVYCQGPLTSASRGCAIRELSGDMVREMFTILHSSRGINLFQALLARSYIDEL